MKRHNPSRTKRFRLESLESRLLMASNIFFEDFDPIDNTQWASIIGGNVKGANDAANFHEGNGLYFFPRGERSATTTPQIIHAGALLEFNIRLGNSNGPWEDIDAGNENVVVEYSTNGTDWSNLHTFPLVDPTFEVASPWGRASFQLPTEAASSTTQFRWRQISNSGSCCDHWAIDNVTLVGASIATISNVTPDPRNTSISQLEFEFETPIDPTSFDLADLSLTLDGGANLLDASVTLSSIDDLHYQLVGLETLTAATGVYQFILDPTNITPLNDETFTSPSVESWTVELTPPQVLDVINVTPDPRTGNGKAVPAIDVVFSEPIDLASLAATDLLLTRDGVPVPLNNDLVFTNIGNNRVQISGLTPYTNVGGNYKFFLDGTYVTDLAGNAGQGTASDTWLANDAPYFGITGLVTYKEDAPPKVLANKPVVLDQDTPIMNGGKLEAQMDLRGDANDRLGILNRGNATGQISVSGNFVRYQGKRIGTFTGGDGLNALVVTFNSNATLAAVQALAAHITYSSVGDFVQPVEKLVWFSLTDGEGGASAPAVKQVNIVPVNDAPVLSLVPQVSYTLNGSAVGLLAAANPLVDTDSPRFNTGSLLVSFTGGHDRTEQIEIGGRFTKTGNDVFLDGVLIGLVHPQRTGVGQPLFIRFNYNATLAVVDELYQAIQFRTLGSDSLATRTVSVKLRDHAGGLASATVNVNVTP